MYEPFEIRCEGMNASGKNVLGLMLIKFELGPVAVITIYNYNCFKIIYLHI